MLKLPAFHHVPQLERDVCLDAHPKT